MATLRYRGDRNILDIAKNLDAFSKVPTEYTETTKIGGTLTLLSRIFIMFLIYKEVTYFNNSNLLFTFFPDVNLVSRVRLNIDITIATPCEGLSSVDLTDDTKQQIFTHRILKRENTCWELEPHQKAYITEMQNINSYLREEYHSITNLLFKDILIIDKYTNNVFPERISQCPTPPNACRIHGTLMLSKVAGMLHFVSGKTLTFDVFDKRWSIANILNAPINFTHRINTFSFGELAGRLVQPLEGDEKSIIGENSVMQYFVDVVPTEVHTILSKFNIYQYSVKENLRNITSSRNSYGTPGIYFKYDWSALKVVVRSELKDGFFDIVQFVIRLCSIIYGIVVISGILNSVLRKMYDIVFSVIPPSNKSTEYTENETVPQTPPPPIFSRNTNVLLLNDLTIDESLPILLNK